MTTSVKTHHRHSDAAALSLLYGKPAYVEHVNEVLKRDEYKAVVLPAMKCVSSLLRAMEHLALAKGLSGEGLDLKKVAARRRRRVQQSVDSIKLERTKLKLARDTFKIWKSMNLKEGRDALEGRMVQIGSLDGSPCYHRELPPTFNSTQMDQEVGRLAQFGAPYGWSAGDIIADGYTLLNAIFGKDRDGLLDKLPVVPAGAVPADLRRVATRMAAVPVRARTPPISPRHSEGAGESSFVLPSALNAPLQLLTLFHHLGGHLASARCRRLVEFRPQWQGQPGRR